MELARWLLENAADVNRQNRFGDTALSSVCHPPLPRYWVDAIELLMAHGADPTIKNVNDESAIDYVRKIPVNWEKVRHLFARHVQE